MTNRLSDNDSIASSATTPNNNTDHGEEEEEEQNQESHQLQTTQTNEIGHEDGEPTTTITTTTVNEEDNCEPLTTTTKEEEEPITIDCRGEEEHEEDSTITTNASTSTSTSTIPTTTTITTTITTTTAASVDTTNESDSGTTTAEMTTIQSSVTVPPLIQEEQEQDDGEHDEEEGEDEVMESHTNDTDTVQDETMSRTPPLPSTPPPPTPTTSSEQLNEPYDDQYPAETIDLTVPPPLPEDLPPPPPPVEMGTTTVDDTDNDEHNEKDTNESGGDDGNCGSEEEYIRHRKLELADELAEEEKMRKEELVRMRRKLIEGDDDADDDTGGVGVVGIPSTTETEMIRVVADEDINDANKDDECNDDAFGSFGHAQEEEKEIRVLEEGGMEELPRGQDTTDPITATTADVDNRIRKADSTTTVEIGNEDDDDDDNNDDGDEGDFGDFQQEEVAHDTHHNINQDISPTGDNVPTIPTSTAIDDKCDDCDDCDDGGPKKENVSDYIHEENNSNNNAITSTTKEVNPNNEEMPPTLATTAKSPNDDGGEVETPAPSNSMTKEEDDDDDDKLGDFGDFQDTVVKASKKEEVEQPSSDSNSNTADLGCEEAPHPAHQSPTIADNDDDDDGKGNTDATITTEEGNVVVVVVDDDGNNDSNNNDDNVTTKEEANKESIKKMVGEEHVGTLPSDVAWTGDDEDDEEFGEFDDFHMVEVVEEEEGSGGEPRSKEMTVSGDDAPFNPTTTTADDDEAADTTNDEGEGEDDDEFGEFDDFQDVEVTEGEETSKEMHPTDVPSNQTAIAYGKGGISTEGEEEDDDEFGEFGDYNEPGVVDDDADDDDDDDFGDFDEVDANNTGSPKEDEFGSFNESNIIDKAENDMSESDRFIKKAAAVCACAFHASAPEKEGDDDGSLSSNIVEKEEGNIIFSLANVLSSYPQEVGHNVNIRDSRKKLEAELFDSSTTHDHPSNVITGNRLMRPFSCYILPIGGLTPYVSDQSVDGDATDDLALHLSMILSQVVEEQQTSGEKKSSEKSKNILRDDADFDNFGDFDGETTTPASITMNQADLETPAISSKTIRANDDVLNSPKFEGDHATVRKPEVSNNSMQDDEGFGANFGDFSGSSTAIPSSNPDTIVSQLTDVKEDSATIVKIPERRTHIEQHTSETEIPSVSSLQENEDFDADFGDFSAAVTSHPSEPQVEVLQSCEGDHVATIVKIPKRNEVNADFGDFNAAETSQSSEPQIEVLQSSKGDQAATIVKIPKRNIAINFMRSTDTDINMAPLEIPNEPDEEDFGDFGDFSGADDDVKSEHKDAFALQPTHFDDFTSTPARATPKSDNNSIWSTLNTSNMAPSHKESITGPTSSENFDTYSGVVSDGMGMISGGSESETQQNVELNLNKNDTTIEATQTRGLNNNEVGNNSVILQHMAASQEINSGMQGDMSGPVTDKNNISKEAKHCTIDDNFQEDDFGDFHDSATALTNNNLDTGNNVALEETYPNEDNTDEEYFGGFETSLSPSTNGRCAEMYSLSGSDLDTDVLDTPTDRSPKTAGVHPAEEDIGIEEDDFGDFHDSGPGLKNHEPEKVDAYVAPSTNDILLAISQIFQTQANNAKPITSAGNFEDDFGDFQESYMGPKSPEMNAFSVKDASLSNSMASINGSLPDNGATQLLIPSPKFEAVSMKTEYDIPPTLTLEPAIKDASPSNSLSSINGLRNDIGVTQVLIPSPKLEAVSNDIEYDAPPTLTLEPTIDGNKSVTTLVSSTEIHSPLHNMKKLSSPITLPTENPEAQAMELQPICQVLKVETNTCAQALSFAQSKKSNTDENATPQVIDSSPLNLHNSSAVNSVPLQTMNPAPLSIETLSDTNSGTNIGLSAPSSAGLNVCETYGVTMNLPPLNVEPIADTNNTGNTLLSTSSNLNNMTGLQSLNMLPIANDDGSMLMTIPPQLNIDGTSQNHEFYVKHSSLGAYNTENINEITNMMPLAMQPTPNALKIPSPSMETSTSGVGNISNLPLTAANCIYPNVAMPPNAPPPLLQNIATNHSDAQVYSTTLNAPVYATNPNSLNYEKEIVTSAGVEVSQLPDVSGDDDNDDDFGDFCS